MHSMHQHDNTLIMLSHVIVDSIKDASHTYHVMVDSTKVLSAVLLIAPNTYRVMVDSTKALSASLLIAPKLLCILTMLWLIAPQHFLCHC